MSRAMNDTREIARSKYKGSQLMSLDRIRQMILKILE